MRRKKSYLFVGLAILLFVSGLIVSAQSMNVNSSATVTTTLGFTPGPDYALLWTPIPLQEREYSVPPGEYQMIYLTDPNAHYSSHLIAPDGLFVQFGQIDVAYSWEQVMSFNDQSSIQALVIHQSAYDLVDGEWLGAAMRNGVVVAGINMHFREIAYIVDDRCALQSESVNPFADGQTDYFYVSGSIIRASHPEEQDIVDRAVSETCVRPTNLQGKVFTNSYSTHSRITNEYDVANLVESLMNTVALIENSKRIFETPDLEPSPVPES